MTDNICPDCSREIPFNWGSECPMCFVAKDYKKLVEGTPPYGLKNLEEIPSAQGRTYDGVIAGTNLYDGQGSLIRYYVKGFIPHDEFFDLVKNKEHIGDLTVGDVCHIGKSRYTDLEYMGENKIAYIPLLATPLQNA